MAKLLRRILLLLVLAAAAAGGYWWFARGPLVTLVAVTRGTVAEVVYATGAVEPVTWAKVVPAVRARIVFHCHCEGRKVQRGDVLARLDEGAPRAELAQAEARRAFLDQEARRQTDLAGRGTVTRQALERTQSELLQIEGLIAAVQARLTDFTIVAPLDGIVLRADSEVGELTTTTDAIFWVGQPKPLWVVAEVNEEDIARVADGQKVLLRTDAFADRQLRATVGWITPKGDPVKKTFRVYLNLPDDTPLRIGMSVEANIVVREKPDALVVPAEAVAGQAVFTIAEGRARRRELTFGIRGTRALEVASGLADGERVIAPIPSGLGDGERVRIREGPR